MLILDASRHLGYPWGKWKKAFPLSRLLSTMYMEVLVMITFGPIPSRRLGRSLGINNIPPKICTYSCVYCQQGHSSKVQIERQAFYQPEEIRDEVVQRLEELSAAGEGVDYLSFVPDGEPTLDSNLGKTIQLLKPLGIKIAVITNASLLWNKDLHEELSCADWISVKVDSVEEAGWRLTDHPSKKLSLPQILDGIIQFRSVYQGHFVTETMMVKGLNDSENIIRANAEYIGCLAPMTAYILVPTRPPADRWVEPPGEENINMAVQTYRQHISNVEYLLGYEGNEFTVTGNIQEDILSITAVHPLREDALKDMLHRSEASWDIIDALIKQEQLIQINYAGEQYYMRKLHSRYKR